MRLDTKTLVGMASRAFPSVEAALDNLSSIETQDAREKAAGGLGFSDPRKSMLAKLPKSKKKKDCTPQEWEAHVKERNEAASKREAVKATPEFQSQAAKFKLLQDAKVVVTRMLFKNLPLKNDWEFDGSINTDGVSVSLQFSRDREVVVSSKTTPAPTKKATKSNTRKEAEGDADYDRHLLTVFEDSSGKETVVAGVDPGRVNMAVVAIVTKDASGRVVKQTWSLGRSQYRVESGIKRQDALKKARFRELEERWEGLGADGAALRTDDVKDITAYLDKYARVEVDWWRLASKRRESRADFQRYIGKRKVLDGFFARVRSELTKKFKTAAIKVGYGSAGMKMKPTGRGEVAVPTTGTFKACVRIFGADNVSSTQEHKTTAVEFESGQRKEAVYRMVKKDPASGRLARIVGHTPDTRMPLVCADDVEAVQEHLKAERERARRRRGATGLLLEDASSDMDAEHTRSVALRYPEIRGLRFSPERRIYLDRDRESAATIARLRTIELLGRRRPSPFCWERARVG